MKSKRVLWSVIALVVVFSMVLAGCQPAAPTATQEQPTQQPADTQPVEQKPTEPPPAPTEPPAAAAPEVLRLAIAKDESSVNPYTYVTGYPGWFMMMLQYDTLFLMDAQGVPQPWLATEAKASEDGLTWDITLQEGVKWHDGQSFTAKDVVFSFTYFKEKKIGRFSRDMRDIESVEAKDDTHLTIKLKNPTSQFVYMVFLDVPIIPEHVWKTVEAPKEQAFDTNVGTGPYKLVDHVADQFYRFVANEDYWAGTPRVKELQFPIFADDTAMIAAFQAQEVDFLVRNLPPEQIKNIRSMEGAKILSGSEYLQQLVYYDTQKEPFNIKEVRQALNLAINRAELVDIVYLGAATVGNPGYIHANHPMANKDLVAPYDPEKAKELLEAAGLKDTDGDGIREWNGEPTNFELLTPAGNAMRQRLAELVADMFKQVGFGITVSAVESTTWENQIWPDFDVANGRDYDMGMWGWSASADPAVLAFYVHSNPAIGSYNLTGYVNPEADKMAEEIIATTDLAQLESKVKEFQVLFADELPFLTLLYPDGNYGFWSNVYDHYVFVTGQGPMSKLSFLEVK